MWLTNGAPPFHGQDTTTTKYNTRPEVLLYVVGGRGSTKVFASCKVPLDLQAWLFGVGLHLEVITSVAKATIYKYHLGLELGNASYFIDLPTLWERTIAVHRWRSISRGGRHQ
ncbi:hypothetical protein LAZ67_20002234 [Cordylochernes scorpioides]|uniref:Uncharacterized protein n=1 Tax=Cordylochernes scorpioides TaxID=51811 RepID=A0ABY6LKZ7_9ARAC|nr:hypothetical protein LAZ67_20002234 [Cordylochernes scorpioides]